MLEWRPTWQIGRKMTKIWGKEDKYMKLHLLEPHVVEKIWGGRKLSKLKKWPDKLIGETWEVSTHQDGSATCKGKNLISISNESIPYIVKFIDTTDFLSVQVHPGDEYAQKNENSKGKTECWIILDAEPGSGLYLGFEEGVTKEKFSDALKNKQDLREYLKFRKVKRGDFFYVPAGSVHAIGPGITLAEVQQASGITYRVWDWNRIDDQGNSRDLHIQQALDVLEFDKEANTDSFFKLSSNVLDHAKFIIGHEDFKLEVIDVSENPFTVNLSDKNHTCVVALDTALTLTNKNESLLLPPYSCAYIEKDDSLAVSSIAKTNGLLVYC